LTNGNLASASNRGDKEDASRDENVVDLSIQDSNIIVG